MTVEFSVAAYRFGHSMIRPDYRLNPDTAREVPIFTRGRLLHEKGDLRGFRPLPSGFTMYGTAMNRPAVVVTPPYDKEPAHTGNGNMVALVMDSREKVDAFHAKALELGGTNEGDPGYRGDPKFGYYFGYFRDPDGHKFAAFTIAPEPAAS